MWVLKVVFSEKYTTQEKISKDISKDKEESKKTVLTNDAFALGKQLELLINTVVNK